MSSADDGPGTPSSGGSAAPSRTSRPAPGGAASDLVRVRRDARGETVFTRTDRQGNTVVHDHRRPFILELELTWRCNLRCVHCYVDATESPGCDELTLEEVEQVLDDAVELGIEELSLTGGEVLLRRDLPEILALGQERGMGLRFVTNGSLLDEGWMERLDPFPLKLVTVSLDAVDPAIHESIRGTRCHAATLAAIDRLLAAGRRVSVITAFSRDNLSEFDAVFEYCRGRRLDWQVQMTSAKGRCSRERVLSPDEYYRLGEKVAAAMASRPGIHVIPMDDLATFSRFEPLSRLASTWQGGCSGGRLNLFVRADGGVTPCSALAFAPFVVGNVREERLLDLCQREACRDCLEPWLDVERLTGACARCPHRERCRAGCPEILATMCDGAHENRYCYWRIEEERMRDELGGLW